MKQGARILHSPFSRCMLGVVQQADSGAQSYFRKGAIQTNELVLDFLALSGVGVGVHIKTQLEEQVTPSFWGSREAHEDSYS